MITPTVVIIPTRDHWRHAVTLACQVIREPGVAFVMIYDNNAEPTVPQIDTRETWIEDGDEITTGAGSLTILHEPDMGIYEMWNSGWAFAAGLGYPVNVAILNDDITILPGTLERMTTELRATNNTWLVSANYDRRVNEGFADLGARVVRGTYRNGGVCGWCFMLRGELLHNPLPPIDTQFEWWCGDDDLCAQINLAGGDTAIVLGCPVDHEGTATGKLYPELDAIGWADMDRLTKKYG